MPGRATFLAILLPALLCTGAPAQSPPCDQDLAGRGTGPFGYARRGERCEGIYRRQVAGSVLYLVSLTEAFGDFDRQSTEPLLVQWSGAGDDTVRLRAEGLRPDLYYRMDAARPSAAGSFEWPLDVIASLRIARSDLGVLSWTTRSLGGMSRMVYHPARIGQRGRLLACGPLKVLLWPGVRLDSVTMSLAPVSAAGAQGAWLKQNEEIGLGYYPAQQPIQVEMPALEGGVYLVRFVAYPRSSSPTPVTYYLQRPAAAAGCTP